MSRLAAWADAGTAVIESSVYSPVWILPVLLVVGTFVPASGSWWATRLHALRDEPMTAFTVVGFLVIFRPLLVFLAPLVLASIGIVFVRRSWAEKVGDELVKCIRLDLPVDRIRDELTERTLEGNADAEHVDSAMWLWLIARYDRDPVLEEECWQLVRRLVVRDPLRERVRVWCLRAWAKLGRELGDLLPPICAPALRR